MKSQNWFFRFIIGFTLFSFCTADRGLFGDNCNKTNRCDAKSSLSCIENKCQCLKPNEMIFDENAKKCRILSGEKCSFTIVETDSFQENRVFTETFDCVENAVCHLYCLCELDYYEDTQGICRHKGWNGERCEKDDECRVDLGLKCNNGFCSCDRPETVFYGKCVGKVGVSCLKYGDCVVNAECGHYDKICTCREGYEKSTDGLCLGKYGNKCNADTSPCMQQFSCFKM